MCGNNFNSSIFKFFKSSQCKVTTFCPNDKVDVKKTIAANTQIWLMHTDFLQKRDDYLLIFRHCVCC